MLVRWISETDPNYIQLPFEPTVVIVGLPPYGQNADNRSRLLRKFLKFYAADTGFRVRSNDLRSWLDRFILMIDINKLTFKCLSKINHEFEGKVFILWGAEAKVYAPIVDQSKHYLMTDEQGSFRDAAEFMEQPLDFWRLY